MSPTPENELVVRFVDDRDALAADELATLVAQLQAAPAAVEDLRTLLVVDELLTRQLGPRRRDLAGQVEQRLRDAKAGPAAVARRQAAILRKARALNGAATRRAPVAPTLRVRPLRVLALAAGLALAVAGGLWLYPRLAGTPTLGLRLVEMQGAVAVTRAGVSVPVSKGLALHDGDRVTVTAGSTAALTYDAEPTRLELHDATATFGAEKGAKRVKLSAGTLVCTVAPQELPLEIQTPHAVARVLGTRFTLAADAAATRLAVVAGLVRLTRAKDRAAVDVPAGYQAAVSSGAELKVETTRPPGLLLDLDFEDRILPEGTVGTVVACPAALSGSRYCVAGEYDGRLFLVNIRNGSKALLTYRAGAVLSFDYWVRRETWALDVYCWNETQSVSRGFTIRQPVQERWTRVVFPLADLPDHAPHDGDLIWDLSVQTTPGGNELFVDNLSIETIAVGAAPGK